MTAKLIHPPLDPFSAFVDADGKIKPEWYTWLLGLSPIVCTVAELPPAAQNPGLRAFCTDVTPPLTFLSTVGAGGGTNKVPVVSDGTNWLIA